MKTTLLIISLLFYSNYCLAQTNNQLTECVVISGTFNQSIQIWKERWASYNSDKTSKIIDNSSISNKLGYYVKQPYSINKNKCYKQINGNANNYIWFGHQLNPKNSFDAWYIGNIVETNTTLTPLTQLSIPCCPTFLPNRDGGANVMNFYATNLTTISESDPTIQRIYLTQDEINNLIQNNESVFGINNTVKEMYVDILNNQITVIATTSKLPSTIDIYRSNDLVNDNFTLLYSNIVVNTSTFKFNMPLNGNIGFYRLVYK